ncbi:type II toxin-antitoxin system HicA family toxin [Hwanghaeella sp.]|uniref:type II toxin-antitoxin system HicA family toxin n=1 Tax=Hwanghaeella sp. TaxID=2605943 RepID=UPI003CCC08CB
MHTRKIMKALEKAGWELVRVKGDHHIFKHATRPGIVVLPHPKRDLPVGTLRDIEKVSGLTF